MEHISLPPPPPSPSIMGPASLASDLPNFGTFVEPTVGEHPVSSLVKAGLTGREIEDISTRPAKANAPKVSWGSVVLAEADNFGYESMSKLAGGNYLVAAAYDNLSSNYEIHRYPKTEAEYRERAYASTEPIQKLLASMRLSAAENRYSARDLEKINRIMGGYTGSDHLNTRAFDMDEGSSDNRLVYSRDMAHLLNLAQVSYEKEQDQPSSYHLAAEDKARAQRNYLRETTSDNAINGGYLQFKDAPSKELIEARVTVKLAEKELFRSRNETGPRIDLFSRREKRLIELESKLSYAKHSLELMENWKD